MTETIKFKAGDIIKFIGSSVISELLIHYVIEMEDKQLYYVFNVLSGKGPGIAYGQSPGQMGQDRVIWIDRHSDLVSENNDLGLILYAD